MSFDLQSVDVCWPMHATWLLFILCVCVMPAGRVQPAAATVG